MNARSLELSDPDQDALTVHDDDTGVWVTCTSGEQEVTVGPLARETLVRWLAAAATIC